MKLYGSCTSPYVRRLRIFLNAYDYQFLNINIFGEQDRARLKALNPTLKIPMLEDEGQIIFDSNVICRYLGEKFQMAPLSWNQANQLTLINAANDSLIELLLCERSKLDTHADVMFFKLQRERLEVVFHELNQQCEVGQFNQWNYPAICLFCLLDWIDFRSLYAMERFQSLCEFHRKNLTRAGVKATDPRNAV